MKILKYIFTVIVAVCFIGSISAQDIIKAAELAKIYKNKDVVVVSARPPADYAKRHITNSVNLNHKDLYGAGPVKSMLKSDTEIAKILGSKGITNDKTIVLYDGGTGKYSGRLYWILDYMGAENVLILDGQMKAWSMARKPVTGAATSVKKGTFTAKVNKGTIATLAQVKAAQKNSKAVLVDVRDAKEFGGTAETKLRKGHIPGAINLEFKEVLNTRSELKTKAELTSLFKAKGISSDKEIILYCESSVRAGIMYMALTSALGYPNVKVYDGAYLEWQANSANPVE